MKTILKNCRLLGTSHDKDMLHDIYVKDGVIEKNRAAHGRRRC